MRKLDRIFLAAAMSARPDRGMMLTSQGKTHGDRLICEVVAGQPRTAGCDIADAMQAMSVALNRTNKHNIRATIGKPDFKRLRTILKINGII